MAQADSFKFARTHGRIRAVTMAGAAALAAFSVPAFADVKAGVDAWSAGDYARAVAEWQLPAQNGDADALFNLAQAYRLGRGVEADLNRARELYQQAAQLGHIKAADNYGLLLFQQGEQDTAMPLIKDAAERGDPRAQYVLGLAHFNADYAQKDWVRAYALLTLSNGAGLPQASTALQQMDQYVPLSQRQEAQVLARQLEQQAAQRRSAELAAVDLGSRGAPPERPAPATRPAPVAAAPVARQPEPAPAPAPVRVAEAAPQRAAPTPVVVSQRPAQAPVAQRPASTRVAPRPEPAAPAGTWRIQLGAFGVAGNADRLWSQLSGNPALAGTRKDLVRRGNITRLHAVGFASRSAAQAACNSLQRQGQGCIVAGNN